MCGLCGVISSTLSKGEIASFRDLMYCSVTRGEQGAGIAFVKPNHKAYIIKSKQTAAHLVTADLYFETVKKANNIRAIIGHARAPTKGGVDDYENIHPHRVKNIVGTHNGTMLNVMKKKAEDNQSDSKMLFEAIADHGLQKTVNESDGAMALVWFDTEAHTMNFYRNYQRPLWFAWNKAKNTLWWASEPWMFYGSARRCGDIDHVEVPAEKLHTIRVDKNIGDVQITEVKKKYLPWFEDKTYESEWTPNQRRHVPLLTNKKSENDASGAAEVELRPGVGRGAIVKTLRGEMVFMNHLVWRIKNGCGWCGNPIGEKELKDRKLLWITKEECLCEDCALSADSNPVWEYFPGLKPTPQDIRRCMNVGAF